MTTSIVIRCLNEQRHLPRLLTSLSCQTHRPDEVLVVDSGSADATVTLARQHGARVVDISPAEFSFGRALNLGARNANGDVLVFASAHTYPVSERWLELLVAPFNDPAVALTYGAQRADARSKYSEQQLFKQWFPPEPCLDQQHPFCNNANAAIRRALWASMPYDEDIPGLEDIHWAKRARQRGFRITYVADAAIVHVHEEPYSQIYRRYRREAMGLKAITLGEHMGLRQAVALFGQAVASDFRAARRDGVWRKVCASILSFRAAQYWGTYRGLNWRTPMTDELRARLYYPGYRRASSVEAASERPSEALIPSGAPLKSDQGALPPSGAP